MTARRRPDLTRNGPPPPSCGGRGPGRVIAAMMIFFFGMAGCGIIVGAVSAAPDPPPEPAATTLPTMAAAARTTVLPRDTPMRVDIDEIDVHAPINPAGVASDGTVAVPPISKPYLTNWYKDGPSPGQAGNAVILGHVDSRMVGAAVFYRLGALKPGAAVTVTLADRTVAVFAVTGVALVSKSNFPTAQVYGPTRQPGLRLITCGGAFDRTHHTYRGNVIVAAAFVSSHRASRTELSAPLRTSIPPRSAHSSTDGSGG